MNERDREVIGLVIVVNGSRGPKLLYRNPKFRSSLSCNENQNDSFDETRFSTVERSNMKQLENGVLVQSSFRDISNINDYVLLQDIIDLKHSRCDRRFHLEIDEVAFLGYPVRWESTMLNVVFVTRANVLTSLSNQLCDLSRKAALMLLQEAEIFHDPYFDTILGLEEHNAYESGSTYKLSTQSDSALLSATSSPGIKSAGLTSFVVDRTKKDVSPNLSNSHHDSFSGSRQKSCRKLVDFLNYLTHIEVGSSLCVTLPSGAYFSFHLHAELSHVIDNLDSLEPYHTILLCPNFCAADELPADFSSSICKFISVACCSKPLYQIATDADLTLSHAMKIAAHLVYWDRAIITYPISQSRSYVLKLSNKGLLWVKSCIGRELKCQRQQDATVLFEVFVSLCGSSGGPFDLGLLYERLSLVSPDLEWTSLKNFMQSLLWCGYVIEIHSYPILFNSNFQERKEIDTTAEPTNNREDDSSNNEVQLSILEELQKASVHVDDLAYKLNLPISRLLSELRQLETKNLIFFCHRLEDCAFETVSW